MANVHISTQTSLTSTENIPKCELLMSLLKNTPKSESGLDIFDNNGLTIITENFITKPQ